MHQYAQLGILVGVVACGLHFAKKRGITLNPFVWMFDNDPYLVTI